MLVAEKSTYIKLDRNILKWRWFTDGNTLKVWIWLLANANIKDHDFLGDTIHRGQVATSRKRIAMDTGMAERQARTALDHLKMSGEVSVTLRPHYQVITIANYDLYQSEKSGRKSGGSPAKVRRKSGGSPQSKNDKNPYGEEGKNSNCVTTTTIPPDRSDVASYALSMGVSIDLDAFMRYNESRGWKVGNRKITDWKPLVDGWIAKEQEYSSVQQVEDDGLDEWGKPIRKEFV